MTRGVFAELGWRWRRVNNSPRAHLVPAVAGRGSRTACNRLAVPAEAQLTGVAGLFGEVGLCERCARVQR